MNKPLQIVRSFLPIVIALILSNEVVAQKQDTTTLVRIETRDGNQYIGRILERNNNEIRVQTEKLGIITIRLMEVVTLDPVNQSQIKNNTVWFEHPQATRYFWSPNGYGLKKGEGYYQNIWVLFNHFSVGVTDDFSIGGGLIPLFLLAGLPTPAWFTPKLSLPVKKDKLNLGVGGLFGGVLGLSDTGFGIVYGTATLGNRGRNLSIGMGYGYAGDDWANYPAISLSGMIRTGPRGYLLTENYYLGSDDASFVLLSFGGRRIIKKTGLDFGLVIPSGDGEIIAVPWLGFTVPFGKGARL